MSRYIAISSAFGMLLAAAATAAPPGGGGGGHAGGGGGGHAGGGGGHAGGGGGHYSGGGYGGGHYGGGYAPGHYSGGGYPYGGYGNYRGGSGYRYGGYYPGFGLAIGIGTGLGAYPYYGFNYGTYAPYLYGGYSAAEPYAVGSVPAGAYQSLYDPNATPPQSMAGGAARITVRLPENARLFVENYETKQAGALREFVSPANLEPGHVYSYTLRAEWVDKGRPVSQSRTVEFQAGGSTYVDLSQPLELLPPVPAQIRAGAGRVGGS